MYHVLTKIHPRTCSLAPSLFHMHTTFAHVDTYIIIYTYSYRRNHAHTNPSTPTTIHVYINTPPNPLTCTNANTRTYTYIHAYIHTSTHTHVHTHVHTYTRTYIHTYTRPHRAYANDSCTRCCGECFCATSDSCFARGRLASDQTFTQRFAHPSAPRV